MGYLNDYVVSRIRAEMQRQDKSQYDMAKRIGVSQSQISARLSGRQRLRVDEVGFFAQALGVSVSWLLGSAETKEEK